MKKTTSFYHPLIDLFGDVPVTHDDVFLWVSVVAPRWIYSKRSFDNYVRCYSVVEKIKAAKLSGHWHDIIARHEYLEPWHERLAIHVIPRIT